MAVYGTAGSSNSLMDISSDGRLLVCSNRDNGSVSVIDLQDQETVHQVPVGAKPEGVSFIGDSHHVAVAVYAEDAVVVVDSDAGKIIRRIGVFDEPYLSLIHI